MNLEWFFKNLGNLNEWKRFQRPVQDPSPNNPNIIQALNHFNNFLVSFNLI